MSVQLIVYPQSYNGAYNAISTSSTEFLVNGINFNGLNSTATYQSNGNYPPYQDVLDNEPASIPNTWYRFRVDGVVAYPIVSGGNLVLDSIAGPATQTGVYQRLTNLTIGATYNITINSTAPPSTGFISFIIADGNNIVSTGGSLATNTLIALGFVATSTDPTIMFAFSSNVVGTMNITSISIQPLVGSVSSGATNVLDNGQVILDLYEDEDLPLTLSVDDFKNVAEKVQSYSKAFKLPATKRNNRIFDQMFEITRSYDGVIFNPYRRTQCVLKQDGFILFEGFLRLLEVTEKEDEISYNVNLYSEVVALADTLKDRKFSDFDFSELEHLYNKTQIKYSWNNAGTGITYTNPGTSGFRDDFNTVKYPFVDWTHQYPFDGDGNPVLPNLESSFRPFINIKYLIDRIFQDTPFTYSSEFFNLDEFKNLFMDFNWGADSNPNNTSSQGVAVFKDSGIFNPTYATTSYTAYEMVDDNLPDTAGWDPSTYIFTCPVNQENSTFNMSYLVTSRNVTDACVRYRWVKNKGLTTESVINEMPNNVCTDGSAILQLNINIVGSVISVDIWNGGYYTSTPVLTISLPPIGQGAGGILTAVCAVLPGPITDVIVNQIGGGYNHLSSFIEVNSSLPSAAVYSGSFSESMEPGDTLELQWKSDTASTSYQNNAPAHNGIFQPSTLVNCFMTANVSIQGVTNDILLQTLRGEIKQWEFIKGIMTMFNLVTLPDEDNPNNIKIEPYRDVFITPALTTPPLDWTDKIDVSEMKLNPLTDLTKDTIFKFTDDDDDYAMTNYKNSVNYIYGSQEYMTGVEFNILEGLDEIVAEPFAGTLIKPLDAGFPDFVIPSIYSYDSESGESQGFDNAPRIMFNNGIKTLTSCTYEIPAQNATPGNAAEANFLQFSHLTSIPISSSTNDFNFGQCQLVIPDSTNNNLFTLYWLPYYAQLYNPDTRTMVIKVNLTPADINTFKFNDTVYIKNRVFRVNKIDYKPNDLATVEFILIP